MDLSILQSVRILYMIIIIRVVKGYFQTPAICSVKNCKNQRLSLCLDEVDGRFIVRFARKQTSQILDCTLKS